MLRLVGYLASVLNHVQMKAVILLWPSAHLPSVLLLVRQRHVAAGNGLGTSLGTTIKCV
jgi:hypothetical protein